MFKAEDTDFDSSLNFPLFLRGGIWQLTFTKIELSDPLQQGRNTWGNAKEALVRLQKYTDRQHLWPYWDESHNFPKVNP